LAETLAAEPRVNPRGVRSGVLPVFYWCPLVLPGI
jgi:hypothetical protein